MRLSALGELALVERIRGRFRDLRRGRLLRGIGDDAAVIGLPQGGKLLATTDLMAEGVHFDLKLETPYQLGFKLVSLNVSDIYAMGGSPLQVLLALALPPETDTGFLDMFMDGVRNALDLYGASLAGGDLSGSTDAMTLTATVIGQAAKPVLRSGARAGDWLYVTGPLGDSACGLELLKKIGRPVDLHAKSVRGPLPWKTMKPLIERHVLPVARRPGAWLKSARAMIDISDGLALDLKRLCIESGVGALVDMESLPVSAAMRKAAPVLGLDPLELALSGGEDYELLFAGRGTVRGRAIRIGEIVKGKEIRMNCPDGKKMPLEPKGYMHFNLNKGGG
ncbi:hypothetical protein LCGC14_1810930 [marine sediment metagenome]|uniref:PurM-like N-terminal domain-containing protein n=1 Tax=marine sediment metagenome TaxID=412755 RepID=A0A0F9JLI9_9ZZZZ